MGAQEQFATASGHWYDKEGKPAYTIIGKNGRERPTTLRDAREHGYVPSVTGIIKLADKPALTKWLINQALDAALTLPRRDDESLDEFKLRALDDSKQQAIKAAADGTELHGSLEIGFRNGPIPTRHVAHYKAVVEALRGIGITEGWEAERSFASSLGYGGKLDLHGPTFVCDYKSKPFIEDGKEYGYDEHCMQLVAYAMGLDRPNAICINLFVGLSDAKVHVKVWTPEEARKAWSMFQALLAYWKAKNGVA